MKKFNLIAALSLCWSYNCTAAEFCATTSAELQSALTSAANNNQHNLIKIATGSYVTPGAEFSYYDVNGWDLTIAGGWSDFFGNPCGQQLSGDTLATVLDGNLLTRVLRIRVANTADIKISNLFIINGLVEGSSRGGGLYLYSSLNDHLGNITLEKSAFINNEAQFGGAVSLSGGSKINFRNNLFVANISTLGNSVSLVQNDANGVYFTNNTVMSNLTDSATATGGLRIYVSGTSKTFLANNLFWGNENNDVLLLPGGATESHYLKYNDIGLRQGATPFVDVGNFSLPPRFDSGILNFTPSEISPLVNKGTKPCSACPIPIPFDQAWILGTTDVGGDVRIQQNKVDIGAFESPYMPDLIFMHGLD